MLYFIDSNTIVTFDVIIYILNSNDFDTLILEFGKSYLYMIVLFINSKSSFLISIVILYNS